MLGLKRVNKKKVYYKNITSNIFVIEASCSAGAQSVPVNATGCGFDP